MPCASSPEPWVDWTPVNAQLTMATCTILPIGYKDDIWKLYPAMLLKYGPMGCYGSGVSSGLPEYDRDFCILLHRHTFVS